MELKLENFNKPSHKKWKLIADFVIYTGIPGITGAIMAIPISDNLQKWLIFAITMLGLAFKLITKLTIEEEPTTTNLKTN